jgi:hypothetical protein
MSEIVNASSWYDTLKSLKPYIWFIIKKSQVDISSHPLFRYDTNVILDSTGRVH